MEITMMNNRTRDALMCFLDTLINLHVRLQHDLFGNVAPVDKGQPVEAVTTTCQTQATANNEVPLGIVWFDEALRTMYWEGGSYTFTYRKWRRFEFILLLWEHQGTCVSAEELANAMFDKENWKWPSIRRYGIRVQQGDLDRIDCPFRIRVDKEGFTLILRL